MCEHEPEIQLGGLIKCRICGNILPEATEEITKVSSARRARRILEELAMAGNYYVASRERGFPIYARDKNGVKEEITAEKLADREYKVYRKLISKGGDA